MTDTPSPDEAALLALADLRERLRSVEEDRDTRMAAGMSDADASLAAAIFAIQAISGFCESQSIERRSINRMCLDLAAVASGRRHSGMLKSRKAPNRPPDHPAIEEIKGNLAAIMEHLQRSGLGQEAASIWVSKKIPAHMKKALKGSAPGTVIDWHVSWGGAHVPPSRGRSGYVMMREALLKEKPSESALPAWIKGLDRYLPPAKESD